MLPEKIITPRICLIRPEISDDLAHEMFTNIEKSSSELKKWVEWVYKTRCENDCCRFIQCFNKLWNNKKSFDYAIHNKETNEFMGMIGTPKFNIINKTTEIEYWLSSKYTGNGYIQEAVRTLENIIFNEGFERISIVMDVENYRSENVAIKLGYNLETIAKKTLHSTYFNEQRDSKIYVKFKS